MEFLANFDHIPPLDLAKEKKKEARKIAISFCSFQDGTFEFYLVDKETSKEVVFEGLLSSTSISEDKEQMLHDIAPACVYTTYEKVD